jgi:hypothetical protein
MLTTTENNVLYRARRDGSIEVAWFSEAEEACKTFAKKGWMKLDEKATNRMPLVYGASFYRITEEGKRG